MLAVAVSIGALSMSSSADNRRQLSYTSILNYNPGSKVTDHSNIDLDQAAIETALGTYDWTTATAIYTGGAHSKPTAVCTLTGSATAGAAIAKKDSVSFTTVNGDTVTGKAYSDYAADATSISFTYPVAESRVQPDDSACYVGGLPAASQKTLGCISGSGDEVSSGLSAGESSFTIGSTTYTATCVNKGKRTLQGFSTKAQAVMYDCPVDSTVDYENGCPYTSYLPYYTYYGDYAYADTIVSAALAGTAITGFTNGGFDLSSAADVVRKEYTKKGTAYMNSWMYVIREFEDAIDDCTVGDLTANALSSGPVHAWDEGVGFYAGSKMVYDDLLAGNLPTLDEKGKMAYTLANKRCQNFITCGPDGDSAIGEAKANIDLFQLFQLGQYELLAGNCAKVVPIKNDIVKKMTVPLVQGTLRYAYKVEKLSGADKEKAEGGIFAAAVLPQLYACDPEAATTVFSNMGWGASSTDFMAVKAAFEGCYESMGITCKDVGGLYNSATSDYYSDGDADASPCVDASTDGTDPLTIVMIIVAAGIAVVCCLILFCMYSKEKAGKPIFTPVVKGAPGAAA
jgi:hypothetical protein